MDGKLFRKKIVEKVSSPEELNNYIQVSTPGVWMALAAMLVFLAGVCVWGIFGHLDTVIKTVGRCSDGVMVCYIREADFPAVKAGMAITVGNTRGKVTEVGTIPMEAAGGMAPYLCHLGGFAEDEWVYVIKAQVLVDDGSYEAQMITERVPPISFVWN